jgi:vacuolar protein-sorting-associated protein 4
MNGWIGSFEKRVYIPLPEPSARSALLNIHIGNTPTTLTPQDMKKIADRTDGFSGADISVLVRYVLTSTGTCVWHFDRVLF